MGSVTVNEVIRPVGMGAGEAAQRLVRVVQDGGQHSVGATSANTFQFARTYRPTWALVLGIVLLPVFGLGLVFFFVKRSETWVAQLAEDHNGPKVTLSGSISSDAVLAVRKALTTGGAGTQPAAPAPPAAIPGANAVTAGQDHLAFAPISSVPGPAGGSAVNLALLFDPEESDTATVLRDSKDQRSRPPTLVFDTGERVVASAFGLVGRDPSPRPGEPVPQLVKITDPERSVSKTHLAFWFDGAALWVADRHSTNGAWLRINDEQQDLSSGERVRAPVGAAVQFGSRCFVVDSGSDGGT